MALEFILNSDRGLIGTWVKIPTLETVEMLAHAGFDFVVIDLEHAPLNLETAYRMIFAAQSLGMTALVRLPDHSGSEIQRLLDAGADGLLVPRIDTPEAAHKLTEQMIFSPNGTRGLGATSRAGLWGLRPREEYLGGDKTGLRIVQLEDWQTLNDVQSYLDLPHVNGVFVGLGDLELSSGKTFKDTDVAHLLPVIVEGAKDAGKISAIAAASVDDARIFLDVGFSLVMVSNDASMFGQAAAATVNKLWEKR